jgi:hypothetical protein
MKEKRYTYDNGLPFSDKLDTNIEMLKERIENRKASLLIIDGGIGEGKTTLGVHIAEYYSGTKLIFEDQLAMGGEDFTKKLQVCYEKGHKVIIYDEAGDFNRRSALTRLNATLNRVFETFRTFGILVILILPSFHVLDKDLFNKNIPRLLLHCQGRNNYYGNYRGYSLFKMLYIKHRMDKLVVKSHAYSMEQPNFNGHYLDLTPERSEELDAYSTAGKKEILQLNEIKSDGLITYYDIAKELKRSVGWVKKTILNLGIEEKRVYKLKKYFDPSVLEAVIEEVEV